jgi:hypothetical protein
MSETPGATRGSPHATDTPLGGCKLSKRETESLTELSNRHDLRHPSRDVVDVKEVKARDLVGRGHFCGDEGVPQEAGDLNGGSVVESHGLMGRGFMIETKSAANFKRVPPTSRVVVWRWTALYGARLNRSGAGPTLEEDDVAEVGLDRLRSHPEDGAEVSDEPVRVRNGVLDVRPAEFTAEGNRVEADTLGAKLRRGDLSLKHLRVEDEGYLVGGAVVARVVVHDTGRNRIGEHPGGHSASKVVAGGEVINNVVEPTERSLNPKRGDQIANLAAVEANVIAVTRLSHEVVRRLGGENQRIDRAAVLAAIGQKTRTLTVHDIVDLVENRVGDVGVRGDIRVASPRGVEVEGNRVAVGVSEGNPFEVVVRRTIRVRVHESEDRGAGRETGDEVTCKAHELVTVAVLDGVTSRLGERLGDRIELLVALSSKEEIFKRKLRRLDFSTLKEVRLQLLGEPNERAGVIVSDGPVAVVVTTEGARRLVGRAVERLFTFLSGSTKRAVSTLKDCEVSPFDPSVGTGGILRGDRPIINKGGELVALVLRESGLRKEVKPRGDVKRVSVDLRPDDVGLLGHDGVKGGECGIAGIDECHGALLGWVV